MESIWYIIAEQGISFDSNTGVSQFKEFEWMRLFDLLLFADC
jgi:hypothetical protein